MLKTILSQVKEFKRVSILTPVFVLGKECAHAKNHSVPSQGV